MVITFVKKLIFSLSPYLTSVVLIPLAIILSIVALSIWAALLTNNGLETARSQDIDRQVRENNLNFSSSMKKYDYLIEGIAGRLNSAPIDRASWEQYMNSLNFERNFEGIYTVGVSQIVTRGDSSVTSDILASLSREYGRQVTLFPADGSAQADIAKYFIPETQVTTRAVGFDISSEVNRREATEKATKTGATVMSEKLELINDPNSFKQTKEPSFILYRAYYDQSLPRDTEAQRQAAVRGHIFAAFQAKDVFSAIFSSQKSAHNGIEVYMDKREEKNLLYSQQAKRTVMSPVHSYQEIQLYGRTVVIDYTFDKEEFLQGIPTATPRLILLSGTLLGLVLAAATFFYQRARYHRLTYEKEREVEVAKRELLSLASHQLRTPATGVKQYMGMVLQGFTGEISPMQKDFLEKAYASNERQLRVINDILHLAKLDLGRIVLSLREFDLAELIRDVAGEQEVEIEKARLDIRLLLPKSALVTADPHMIRMIIENLLSNAIKYTDPDGKISITLRRQGATYRISVKDNGVGISEENYERLFQQFSRIPNDRTQQVTGTGVGLYLAQHLAKMHGGQIVVESKVGKGSTFSLELPKTCEISHSDDSALELH